MSNIVTASDGAQLDLDNYVIAFGYTGSNLTSLTINDGNGNTYKQTLTYVAGNITNRTGWVKQ